MLDTDTRVIEILLGLPCSGKSTYAMQRAFNNPHTTIIISLDSIRQGLGMYWVPQRHNYENIVEYQMLEHAMLNGYHIILDDTKYLNKAEREEIHIQAEQHGYKVRYKNFKVPVRECVLRAKSRKDNKHITEAEITRIYNETKQYNDFLKIK